MKTKITRILSVAMTVALLVGLFVSAAPLSAGDNSWSKFGVPSSTNMQLNTTITAATAFAQSPVDGALYAAVTDQTNKLLKSTDGGRTWKSITTAGLPAAAVAIVPSPTEADAVFYVSGATLYRSIDGGVTFLTVLNAPTNDAFTALDIAQWGGRYIAVVGTDDAGGSAGGVFYWDENDVANNLTTWGSAGSTFGLPVLALSLAPTFNVDRAMVVVGVDTTAHTAVVRTNVNGGAWGAVVNDVVIGSNADPTAADIAFPSDYNASATPTYFIVVSDTDAADGGAYRIMATTAVVIDVGDTWNNVSINGAWASLNAALMLGSSAGTVMKSTNSGISFSAVNLRSNGSGTAWVLVDKDYATNNKAYVLSLGGAGGAFNVSINSMANFNQWSLVNETITNIVDLAIASNGDMFMITGTADSIWRYFGGVWERVAVGITGDIIRVSPAYATDNVVMYALKNSTNNIRVSANSANSFTDQAAKPGSTDGVANNVMTLLVLGANHVVVGSTGGVITTSVNGFYWPEVAISGWGTIVDLDVDPATGDLLAVDVTHAAISSDSGLTWTANSKTADNIVAAAFGASYATTGMYFITGSEGTFKSSGSTFSQIDANGDEADAGNGIVSGPGVVDMVYATDGAGATDGVVRVRTNDAYGERLDGPATTTFTGLWFTPGSNKLWTIDTTGDEIYTWTDTMNVAGSGVSATATGTETATVTWTALTDATKYTVVVHTSALTNFFTAVAASTFDTTTTATTASATGLTAGTKYYVSVWATAVSGDVSSFLFGGAAVDFTTDLNPVRLPTGLAPAPAAPNVPVMPSFQWNAPAGATPTGYLLEVSIVSDFATTILRVDLPPAETYYAWQGDALSYGTVYYWRVTATGTANSLPVSSVFTSEAEPVDPVDVTTTDPNIVVNIPPVEQITPAYIWAIIAVGFVLTVAVIILIVRTRRVV